MHLIKFHLMKIPQADLLGLNETLGRGRIKFGITGRKISLRNETTVVPTQPQKSVSHRDQ
jgi:hypothetical protein